MRREQEQSLQEANQMSRLRQCVAEGRFQSKLPQHIVDLGEKGLPTFGPSGAAELMEVVEATIEGWQAELPQRALTSAVLAVVGACERAEAARLSRGRRLTDLAHKVVEIDEAFTAW